jgi:sec-independent protein translocase protein TatA
MVTVADWVDALSGAPVLAWAVGWQEILIIVVVVLILFGGRKIPELAKGIGRGLREFKREMRGVKRDFEESLEQEEEEAAAPRKKRRRKRRKAQEPAAEEEPAEGPAEEADQPEDARATSAAEASGEGTD